MWYQHLSQYLLSHGFKNDDICPCIFIKHYLKEFVIIAIYVDDLYIIGTSDVIEDVVAMLRCQFEMKDLGLTTFCLGLQIEHLSNGIFLHQSCYIHKILKRFSMDQAHSIRTPMVVRSLDPSRDPFRPRYSNESALDQNILTWLLLVHLCTCQIVRVWTFRSLSICWLNIVTILPEDTGLELSRFSDIDEALKIWVFSLPTILCTVN